MDFETSNLISAKRCNATEFHSLRIDLRGDIFAQEFGLRVISGNDLRQGMDDHWMFQPTSYFGRSCASLRSA